MISGYHLDYFDELSSQDSRELINTSEVIKFTQTMRVRRYNSLTTNYINSKLLLYIRISCFLRNPKTKKQSRFNDHFDRIYTLFVLYIIIGIIRYWTFLSVLESSFWSAIGRRGGRGLNGVANWKEADLFPLNKYFIRLNECHLFVILTLIAKYFLWSLIKSH